MKYLRPELDLPSATHALLLSDLHLGDGTAGDLFGQKDARLLSLLERELPRMDAVVLNGDILDHQRTRTTRPIERAHPEVMAALRALPNARPVYYVLGNHEDEAEVRAAFPEMHFVSALTVGRDLCVTHGHQLDLHWSEGAHAHFAAGLHAFLERRFRRPVRQPFRDYDNWLNRVVHISFFRYTQLLRLRGALYRSVGRPARYERWRRVDTFWARGQWGDIGGIFEEAARYLDNGAPFRTLVLGHTHNPGVVGSGRWTYANLGSWALEQASWGELTQGRVRVYCAATGREYGAERYREILLGRELPDMAGWFGRYYRGFFRYDVEAIARDFPADPSPRE
ncbi:MAG: metallophosphoesterase family protein [Deltaproteobacteria bacterium]|nr:metallophosphoesterase family protein [Deltaproteobacteria bacterium]